MSSTRNNSLPRRPVGRLLGPLFGLLILVAASTASAQAPLKVAVVDLDLVFVRSEIGQTLRKQITGLETETKTKLEAQSQVGVDLQNKLAAASPEEQRSLRRQLEDIELTLRRIRDDAQRQAAKMEADKRKEFEAKLEPIFEALQAEAQYDLILNKTAGVVIFSGPSIEITQTVLERLK